MKELTFTVTVRFSDKITDDNEIREVAKNIVDALENQSATAGLAPVASDTFTESISVTPHFLNETIDKVL